MVSSTPDLGAIYMQSDAVMLPGACSTCWRSSAGKLKKVGEPGHIFLVSIDGTPFAHQKIREDLLDASLSQPAGPLT